MGQDLLVWAMWPWSVERLGLPCVGLSWGIPGEAFRVQGAYATVPHEYDDLAFQDIGLVVEAFDRFHPARPDRSLCLTLFPEYSPDVERLRLRVREIPGVEEFVAEVCLHPRDAAQGCASDLAWWERRLEGLQAQMGEASQSR